MSFESEAFKVLDKYITEYKASIVSVVEKGTDMILALVDEGVSVPLISQQANLVTKIALSLASDYTEKSDRLAIVLANMGCDDKAVQSHLMDMEGFAVKTLQKYSVKLVGTPVDIEVSTRPR